MSGYEGGLWNIRVEEWAEGDEFSRKTERSTWHDFIVHEAQVIFKYNGHVIDEKTTYCDCYGMFSCLSIVEETAEPLAESLGCEYGSDGEVVVVLKTKLHSRRVLRIATDDDMRYNECRNGFVYSDKTGPRDHRWKIISKDEVWSSNSANKGD